MHLIPSLTGVAYNGGWNWREPIPPSSSSERRCGFILKGRFYKWRVLLLAAESRAEGRVVSAEGRKTAFPSPPPPKPSFVLSSIPQSLPDSTGNSLHKYPIFYTCVHVHDTPVKGIEKTTGMKVFQMLCLLDRKKGVDGLLGLRRRFRDEWNFELARVEGIIGRYTVTGQSGGNRGKQQRLVCLR